MKFLNLLQMIKVLSNQQIENVNYTNWEEFSRWFVAQKEYQFDIETTIHNDWCEKKIVTLQFGNTSGTLAFVLEYSILTPEQLSVIKNSLESWDILKVIHRASFEYIIMSFHAIEIHNVYCTLVAEKILKGGVENEEYSLLDLVQKYCGIQLDKTLQTSFGDYILTAEKIDYAASDVIYLASIKEQQEEEIKKWNLENVVWLEMRSLLAFSECTFHGVLLNKDKWRDNVALAQPIVDEAKVMLNNYLLQDLKLHAKALELNRIVNEDTLRINWNSPKQKLSLLQLVFPDLEGASKAFLTSYMRKTEWKDNELLNIFVSVQDGDFTVLEDFLLQHHKEYLLKEKFFVEKGTIEVNWNSRDQTLPLLQAVEPRLKDLSAESVSKCNHEVFEAYSEYVDTLKLTTSFGLPFIDKYVESDGKVRTQYNPIVSTGRSSSASPNMQNIPAKEKVGTRYRNAFEYTPGWKFVDSDFSGQELALIAHAAQDEVWFTAIQNGEDLHSVTAEMVFKDTWKKGQEENCTYYNPSYVKGDDVLTIAAYNEAGKPEGFKFCKGKQKCKCKKHKTLRTGVKTINFGLAYGMSKFKLSGTLKISLKEADQLIEDYFKAFPKIKIKLDAFGYFGLVNGYIQTLPPFGRKRWFPYWEYSKKFLTNHRAGQYNAELGSIERASKNMPFQGSGGDMIKLSMWLTYKFIRDNNLQDKIHILLNVHDQLTTACVAELAPWWKVEFDKLMVQAGKVIVTSGILKADTNISDVWTK